METKFKTFINSHGEYGVIQFGGFGDLFIGTSNRPEIYAKGVTVESLKEYYCKYRNDETQEKLDWENDIPKDWELVDIELNIIE